MLEVEILPVLMVITATAMFSWAVYKKRHEYYKLDWYEEGIGGYSITGNKAYPSIYSMTEVNPFDYYFSPMPEGTFNAIQPFFSDISWLYALIALTGLAWVMINVPEFSTVAQLYFALALFVMIVGIAERISPSKTDMTGFVALGYGAWDKQIIIGVVIGTFIIVLGSFGLQFATILQLKDMPLMSFVLSVLIVPMVEETVFRNVIGMSFAEQAGWVGGVIATSIMFAVFHVYVYQASFVPLLNAFIFGVLAQISDYKYKSVLPGLVGHMIINFYAVFIV